MLTGFNLKFVLHLVWLAVSFWNITIAKESEPNVKEVRALIDGENMEEEQVC